MKAIADKALSRKGICLDQMNWIGLDCKEVELFCWGVDPQKTKSDQRALLNL